MEGWQSVSYHLKAEDNILLFDDTVQCPISSRKGVIHRIMARETYFQLLQVSRKSARAVLPYLRSPNYFAGIAKQLPFYKHLNQTDLSDFSSIALGLGASSFLEPDHWRDSKY